MGGFKDKDLIADGCGKTKHREYGQHKRPPRMQQRNNQRKRYLNKDEKRDMSAQELDLKLDDNGQVYVQEEPSNNQVLTFKDIVQMPDQVQDMSQYHDYNTSLQQSLNDIGGGFDVQVNQQKPKQPVQFDFVDTNIKQPQKSADVSNDDLILSQQQQQTQQQPNPFDDIFSQQNNTSDQQTTDDKQQNTSDQQTTDDKQQDTSDQQTTDDKQQDTSDQQTTDDTKDKDTQKQQDKEDQSNDPIDQYLKMQIDDSKLSEQNKEKLDAFTQQQLDAFKKFLYEKRNGE